MKKLSLLMPGFRTIAFVFVLGLALTSTSKVFAATKNTIVTPPNQYCLNGGVMDFYDYTAAKSAGLITESLVADLTTHTATAKFTNTSGCKMPISLSTYMMYDNVLSHQVYYSGVPVQQYGASVTLTVPIPDCMTQIDLWLGDAPKTLLDSNPYFTRVIDYTFTYNPSNSYIYANGKFCTSKDKPGCQDQADKPKSDKDGKDGKDGKDTGHDNDRHDGDKDKNDKSGDDSRNDTSHDDGYSHH